MECAKRVKVPSRTEQPLGIVSISKILTSEGKDLVKACEYACPDESCGVRVWPVIPLKLKHGRKKSPQAHFRASRKDPHKTGCNAEGITRPSEATEKQQAPSASRRKRSRQGAYPTRYTELDPRGSVPHRKADDEETGEDFSQPQVDGRTESFSGIDDASTSTATLVRKLVEIYENPPSALSSMPLAGVPNCPGRSYATAFRSVGMFASDDGHAARQFIYYGEIESLKTYGSGVWVRFHARGRDTRPLGVWISASLEPRATRDELLRRIQREDARFRLYALGAFEPKFSGESIPLRSRVWGVYGSALRVKISSRRQGIWSGPGCIFRPGRQFARLRRSSER